MIDNQVRPIRKLKGAVPFSVMARVAMQLGRESISNSITAISRTVIEKRVNEYSERDVVALEWKPT